MLAVRLKHASLMGNHGARVSKRSEPTQHIGINLK